MNINNQEKNFDQSKKNSEAAPFFQVFRFADKVDVLMMIWGIIGSLGTGACTPASFYVIIQYNNSFKRYDNPSQIPDGLDNMVTVIYIGIAAFLCGWVMPTMWVITGQRQSSKCKQAYYESLIKQDSEYFDCNEHTYLNSKFKLDTNYFQTAIGEKIGLVLQTVGNFLTTIALSFWQGWFMTVVMLCSIIFLFLSGYIYMQSLAAKQNKFQQIYSKAGGRAEEAINSIKTVKQFNAQNYESKLFTDCLSDPSTDKLSPIIKISLGSALLNSVFFFIYSFGFWFAGYCLKGGSVCLTDVTGGLYTPENIQFIFFSILVCITELAEIPVAIKQVMFGREAAFRIFKVIDRIPKISITSGGLKLETLKGKVELKNVTFAYPKNKSSNVLDGISLIFDSKSSAIVGESGCGKSTIVQLLMRLYDPDGGQVLIDGHDIRELDPIWLRSKIGYVGQQPVLFAATIRENFLYANPIATEEQMAEALKQAQVYDFVFNHLQKGLDTYVGVGGSQISGGQKQRIAIARALIKQPKLLILDEATSALDRTNQRLIQETLNKISQSLTTITIAHRISTICTSRTVFVLDQGRIKEQGKFQDIQYFKKQKQQKDKKEKLQSNKLPHPNIISTSQLMLNSMERINIEDEPSPDKATQTAQKNAERLQRYQESLTSRIFFFNKNKKLLYGFSLLISTGVGLIYPIFSMFLAEIYVITIDYQDSDTQNKINTSSLKFLINAVCAFALYFLQTFSGETVGDQISNNLRTSTYNKILKMPISWFERRENTSGEVSSRLSVQCEKVKDLITNYYYFILRSISIIVSGSVIMFVFDWRMALILIGIIVILVLAGVIKSHFKTNLTRQINIVSKKTGGMIQESIINIRTVSAFNMQDQLVKKYQQELKKPFESLIKIGVIAGIMNGIVIFIVISAYGIFFEIGIQLMIHKGADRLDVLKAIFSFNFMAIMLSYYMPFLPDVEGAKLAAVNIFSILDEEDQLQRQQREGSRRLEKGFEGAIQLREVSFKYEDRQQMVLEGLNLHINPGQKVALVGHSGCGKSTLIQLLLRFYEPTTGSIFVGDTNIRDFDLAYLRRQFGVVGQQPVVFNGSFRDNIRYNTPNITEQQLRQAALKANALTFIERPQQQGEAKCGFDREVGVRGFHISGGQKQRVAIARVLLRSPQVLLLDEATSALDADNQREVQESLDSAMKGRTTVTVAHRIETIKNSDAIHVFQKGSIVESGKYLELMEKKGIFWKIERGNQH